MQHSGCRPLDSCKGIFFHRDTRVTEHWCEDARGIPTMRDPYEEEFSVTTSGVCASPRIGTSRSPALASPLVHERTTLHSVTPLNTWSWSHGNSSQSNHMPKSKQSCFSYQQWFHSHRRCHQSQVSPNVLHLL